MLVAGPDFGTGSSSERAVWALCDYGFRVVFSPRFGDIFRGNAGKQGLLAATVSEEDLERIWAEIDANPGAMITVDLEARTATIGGIQADIGIDDYTRWRLLEGLDDIGLTLRNEEKIAQFEARRESWRPRTPRSVKRSAHPRQAQPGRSEGWHRRRRRRRRFRRETRGLSANRRGG